MCGVAGILALSDAARRPDRRELARMTNALAHRGPDDAGAIISGPAALAHTRLAILDREGGRQPMVSEGGAVLSYNGEVFDYVELREELRAAGHTFVTESDTEVVLRAYEEWGEECFARFDGQFAIAIWDSRQRALLLARDRVGVRPLHICEHDGRVYFASEVKAIFAADPSIPRELDPIGMDETLTFWSVVAPRTAFAAVEELPPGHLRVYRHGARRERAWWRPRFVPTFRGTREDAAAAVREALDRATRLRLRADVPVGAYLSGGLDSSLVAALAQKYVPKLTTFSLRFDDDEYDEGRFQRMVAAELGSSHEEIVVRGEDIARAFPDVVAHAERPILRTAPAPLLLLSRLVRRSDFRVVLTGEGADEMFAGYDLFREAKVRRFWARQPSSALRPRLLERLYPWLARSPVSARAMAKQFFGIGLDAAGQPGFGHDPRWRTTRALARLLSPEMRRAIGDHDARAALLRRLDVRAASPLAQDQLIEIVTLLSGYILPSQGDRMLMASSVEGRFPFLDRDVMELAMSLPDSYRLHVLDEKHVVKHAAAGLVPAAVIRRKKQPYRAPVARCFVGPSARGAAWAAELLSPGAIADANVFDPAGVAKLVAKCASSESPSNTDDMALAAVLSTQLLHATYVRRLEVTDDDRLRVEVRS